MLEVVPIRVSWLPAVAAVTRGSNSRDGARRACRLIRNTAGINTATTSRPLNTADIAAAVRIITKIRMISPRPLNRIM